MGKISGHETGSIVGLTGQQSRLSDQRLGIVLIYSAAGFVSGAFFGTAAHLVMPLLPALGDALPRNSNR